jgi:hypothetical protein
VPPQPSSITSPYVRLSAGIADAAGHITSVVTRNVYRHQLADKLTKASAAMDRIFSPGQVSCS